MSTDKNQSAIREVRDQLFLDTADGLFLSRVGANLGIDRPIFGFGDDEWRALLKNIALERKLITKIFRKIIEICVGPQYNRTAVLEEDVAIGDKILNVADASQLIQIGTLEIDKGIGGVEETVEVCFVDYKTNEVFLTTGVLNAHTSGIPDVTNYLLNDVAASATELYLYDTSLFPTSGFPYTISLGKGTLVEELITVTANDTFNDKLTVSATVNAHSGFKSDFLRRELLNETFTGRTFLQFDLNDTEEFPESGWIRIDAHVGTSSPKVLFEDVGAGFTDTTTGFNDATSANYQVFPVSEAVGDYAAFGFTIPFSKLIFDGLNGTAGVGGVVIWEYWDGSAWQALVNVSDGTSGFTAALSDTQEVTWDIPSDWDTTSLDSSPQLYFVRARITTVYTTNPIYDQGFIGTSEIVFYDNNDVSLDVLYLDTPLRYPHAASASVELLKPGADVSTAQLTMEGVHWDIFETTPRNVKIFIPEDLQRNRLIDASYLHAAVPPAASTTLAANLNATDTTVTLTDSTGFPDEAGLIQINGTDILFYILRDENTDVLTLSKPAGVTHPATTTVDLYRLPYAGTDLEEGNIRDAGGAVQENQFSGPYTYKPTFRGVSDTESTISSLIPPPTRFVASQDVGFTNIEVEDASLYVGISTPFTLRLGRSSGFQEDRDVTDVTLSTTADTLPGGASPTDTTLTLANSSGFPETAVVNKAGYRVILSEGLAAEEIVTVIDNDAATVLTLDPNTPVVNTHAASAAVRLLNDTITVDALTKHHEGNQVDPTKQGHLVEKVTEQIDLVASAGFPLTGDIVYINFGKERITAEARLTAINGPALYEFDDTSVFPTTDFPYQVILSVGKYVEELVNVTANNIGTNELTFSATPSNTHAVGSYVRFISGVSEVLEYQDVDANSLVFDPPIVLESKHTIGERVILSTKESFPVADGNSYPFYLPPDPLICLKLMFDLVRAAGVKVTIIDNK